MKPSLIKEAKSKKVRTQSNIDEDDLAAAIQLNKNKNNVTSSPSSPSSTTVTSKVTVNGSAVDSSSAVEPQAQVGSIKSIQVHSKKVTTTVKISSKASPTSPTTNGTANGYVGNYPQPDEVDDLINKAPSLIDSNDIPSSYEGDKDDVYVASLDRGEKGLGLGLIDGMVCCRIF